MVSKIISGIAGKLNAAFGENYRIYRNDVEQGLQEPCFFIVPLSPTRQQVLGRRYRQDNPFDIHYFPSQSEQMQSEMDRTADQLFETLEYITLEDGDLLRGTGMRYEIIDNVLHFFVDFNLYLFRQEEKENMETLESRVQVKNNE